MAAHLVAHDAAPVSQTMVEMLILFAALACGVTFGSTIKREAEQSRTIHGGRVVPDRRVLQLLSSLTAVAVTSRITVRAEFPIAVVPHLIFGLTLVAISTIDWCQHRIPNIVIRPVFVGCVMLLCLSSGLGEPGSLTSAGVGAAGFWGLLRFVHQIQPDGMGMGDVRLAALLGLFIGWTSTDWPHTGQRVGATLLLGSLFGIVLALATHHQHTRMAVEVRLRKAEVPFGPALSLATGFVIYAPGY